MAQIKTTEELDGVAEQLTLPYDSDNLAWLREQLDLVTDDDFARALDVEPQTLAVWRTEGKGPAYAKLGKGVFYRRDAIKRWADRRMVYTADDPDPGYAAPERDAA